MGAVDVVSTPLGPLRRAVLEGLRAGPASATELASQLGESRQRVNYHVRALERDGLVELHEERARRGCTERVVRATCHAVLVEPSVVGELPGDQDRFAADTLLAGGARLVRRPAAPRKHAASGCSRSRSRPRSGSPAPRTSSASPTLWPSASPSWPPSSAPERGPIAC